MVPTRAYNIFENFWGDRFNEIEDDFFKPVITKKLSRDLDKVMNQGWDTNDWRNVKEGESYQTQTYYTNKNGVETKKSITNKTKYVDGVPTSETI